MLFNSFQFAFFFALVVVLLRILPRRFERNVLVAASLVFYALWLPTLLLLLLGLLGSNYLLVRRMQKSAHPRRHLTASIAVTLAVLVVFKYGPLVTGTLLPVVPSVGPVHARLLSVLLPLGISFYSFEIISLSVDIHKGNLPCPSFGNYVLFVTFFPHLIAGPIMRGRELLPQFEAGRQVTPERTRRGLWLFAVGLLKKTVLSDWLLAPIVAVMFRKTGDVQGPAHLIAMYSFAFLIYFDFSGYTDMARGLSCILGFELTMNFEEPYLSRDPSEFWRRWHMSLSRWLRDYLYVPLGGNRLGRGRTLANLMITMVLGGLWHGAGLNFLVWGALHGLLLVLYRLIERGRTSPRGALRWRDVPSIVITFHLVCLLWIPFRSPSWQTTLDFYKHLFTKSYLRDWPLVPLAIVVLCGMLHVFERWGRQRLPVFHAKLAASWWGPAFEGAFLGSALSMAVLASGAGAQFIYFQF
jgi:alginate O-acetyltransferase complex protein AlgI